MPFSFTNSLNFVIKFNLAVQKMVCLNATANECLSLLEINSTLSQVDFAAQHVRKSLINNEGIYFQKLLIKK